MHPPSSLGTSPRLGTGVGGGVEPPIQGTESLVGDGGGGHPMRGTESLVGDGGLNLRSGERSPRLGTGDDPGYVTCHESQ